MCLYGTVNWLGRVITLAAKQKPNGEGPNAMHRLTTQGNPANLCTFLLYGVLLYLLNFMISFETNCCELISLAAPRNSFVGLVGGHQYHCSPYAQFYRWYYEWPDPYSGESISSSIIHFEIVSEGLVYTRKTVRNFLHGSNIMNICNCCKFEDQKELRI